MNGFFLQAGIYIVTVVFEVYLLAVVMRFLMQLVRADFHNPIGQFSVALTNPALRALRRFLPGLFGIDIASVVLMIVVKGVEIALLDLLVHGYAADGLSIALRTLRDLLILFTNVLFFAVIIRALLSWVIPYGQSNPVMSVLVRLTEPLLRPARRVIPPIGGLDISPIAVIVALRLLTMLIYTVFGSGYLA
jgi:YggT family protein